MTLKKVLLGLAVTPLAGAETILGVYMLHRHGDRTPKTHRPVNMTALGASQVYQSGKYYRQRYVEPGAESKILGVSSDIAVPSELTVQSPVDPVLQMSGQVFLQSLYPPVGSPSVEELANGTKVSFPFDGYQYIPINTEAASNDHSEEKAWLQEGSGCGNALVSSNAYFSSQEYFELFDESLSLYQSLIPIINGTFKPAEATFKNGYIIWDLINVALIHNRTIPSANLLTESTMTTLKTLADIHEWNLAYNASSPIRAIAGKILAGQILSFFDNAVSSASANPRFGIQFGAYATFTSFFGLADMPATSSDFTGIVKYASSMVFELFTEADDVAGSNWPVEEDLKVRFLFANGSAAENQPRVFPLFGLGENEISWTTFVSEMMKFAVVDDEQWCTACGNTTGICATYVDSVEAEADVGNDSGLSTAAAGVVGALVTMVATLVVAAAIMVFGDLRVVKKGARAFETKATA